MHDGHHAKNCVLIGVDSKKKKKNTNRQDINHSSQAVPNTILYECSTRHCNCMLPL